MSKAKKSDAEASKDTPPENSSDKNSEREPSTSTSETANTESVGTEAQTDAADTEKNVIDVLDEALEKSAQNTIIYNAIIDDIRKALLKALTSVKDSQVLGNLSLKHEIFNIRTKPFEINIAGRGNEVPKLIIDLARDVRNISNEVRKKLDEDLSPIVTIHTVKSGSQEGNASDEKDKKKDKEEIWLKKKLDAQLKALDEYRNRLKKQFYNSRIYGFIAITRTNLQYLKEFLMNNRLTERLKKELQADRARLIQMKNFVVTRFIDYDDSKYLFKIKK